MSADGDVAAIERLKYRYVRCLDQKLWPDLRACLTVDATASYGGGAYVFEGRDTIVEWLEKVLGSEQILSSHRVSQPEIDLEGRDTARGVWALDDTVVHQDADVSIRGAAFYRDEYSKVEGQWLIRSTGYKRIYEEIFPRGSIEGLSVTASWWGTGGRSTLPV